MCLATSSFLLNPHACKEMLLDCFCHEQCQNRLQHDRILWSLLYIMRAVTVLQKKSQPLPHKSENPSHSVSCTTLSVCTTTYHPPLILVRGCSTCHHNNGYHVMCLPLTVNLTLWAIWSWLTPCLYIWQVFLSLFATMCPVKHFIRLLYLVGVLGKKSSPVLRYLHFIMYRHLLSWLQCTFTKFIPLLFLFNWMYIGIFVSLDSLSYFILRLPLFGKIHHIPRSWRQKHTSCSVKGKLLMERLPKIM